MDCPEHAGRHVFEDLVIVENVDADDRPVPDGQPGARLLVTNLWNRTQPVIRYELSDIVALESAACRCGRTFRRIVSLEGRSDDILVLDARGGGTVPVHPLTVRSPFAADEDVRQYQIIYDGRRLTIRLVPQDDADPAELATRIRSALAAKLAEAGAEPPPIAIELVPAVERGGGPSGKFKLIEVRPPADLHAP
jgi:phenylacetate-coenzyme A ligase PaaK-like adenylate-forming protein